MTETEISARTHIIRTARLELRQIGGTPDQMWRMDNRAAVALVGERTIVNLAALPNGADTMVAVRAAAEASL